MLIKEIEEVVMGYNRILKEIDRNIAGLKAKLEVNRLETLDLMHEADPRNHIVGLPKKRKVDSRVAMSLGLKLKELSMAHRDLKDDLAALEVIRQQFPKGSKSELAVYNVANFVQCGKSRKYMRRAGGNK